MIETIYRPQRLKYLLSGPLQKKVTDLCCEPWYYNRDCWISAEPTSDSSLSKAYPRIMFDCDNSSRGWWTFLHKNTKKRWDLSIDHWFGSPSSAISLNLWFKELLFICLGLLWILRPIWFSGSISIPGIIWKFCSKGKAEQGWFNIHHSLSQKDTVTPEFIAEELL